MGPAKARRQRLGGRTQNGYSEQACAPLPSCLSRTPEVGDLAGQPLLARSFNRLDVSRLAAEAETVAPGGRRSAKEPATAPATGRCPSSPRRWTASADHRGAADHPLGRRGGVAAAASRRVPAHPGSALAPGPGRLHPGDVAHGGGVGSVGLRAYVALLVGSTPEDVVFLQLKQARRSVLARYVHGESAWHAHQGQRVVEYQQALQTVSDPLLGWTTMDGLQYYVRQFRNMKGTIPLDAMDASALVDYAGVVGQLLAKGHARTSGASMIAGYLGRGRCRRRARAFRPRYADQTESDWAALVAAAKAGRLPLADDPYISSAFARADVRVSGGQLPASVATRPARTGRARVAGSRRARSPAVPRHPAGQRGPATVPRRPPARQP